MRKIYDLRFVLPFLKYFIIRTNILNLNSVKRYLYLERTVLIVFFFAQFLVLHAQDIHFTNFGFSPLNVNPGLTGVFPGDVRANASYKQQWGTFADLVSYTTFSASADMKLGKKNAAFNPWRAGVLINYDQAGWSRLQNISVSLAGSYALMMSKLDMLSVGASAGFNQRAFKTQDLTWDDQYVERVFDPTVRSKDLGLFDESTTYPTLNLGVNYHRQMNDSRGGLDLGIGAFQINKPSVNFRSGTRIACDPRYSASLASNLPIGARFDLLLDGVYQIQGPHKEVVLGIGGRMYLINQPTNLLALQAGIELRGGDAYSPHIGVLYNQWRVSVNFDTNYSTFTNASNGLGGPEVHVMYIFKRVRPANYCPLCPTSL